MPKDNPLFFNLDSKSATFLQAKELPKQFDFFFEFLRRRWWIDYQNRENTPIFPLLVKGSYFAEQFVPQVQTFHIELIKYCRAKLRHNFDELAALVVDHLGQSELCKRQLETGGEAMLLGRPDVIIAPSGNISILELNIGPGFGGLFEYEMQLGFLRDVPTLFKDLENNHIRVQSPLLSLAEALDRSFSGTLAVVDNGNGPTAFSLVVSEYLGRYRKGGKTLYANAWELMFDQSKERICLDACPIDGLYLNMGANHVDEPTLHKVFSFPEQEWLHKTQPQYYKIFSSKAMLAVLYQDLCRGVLPQALADLTEKMVLPSFIVKNATAFWENETITIPDFLRQFKDELVLKPACSEGAMAMLIGKTATQKAWDEFVTKILAENTIYVAQKFVTPPTYEAYYMGADGPVLRPCKAIFSPFIIDGKISALGARLGSISVEGPLVSPATGDCGISIVGVVD